VSRVTLLPADLLNNVRHRDFVRIHKMAGPMGRVRAVFIRRADSFVSSALSTFLGHVRDSLKQRDATDTVVMSDPASNIPLHSIGEVSCAQASKKDKKASMRQTP
jgi:hypothetical protein